MRPVFTLTAAIALLGVSGCHQAKTTRQAGGLVQINTNPTDLLIAFKVAYGKPVPVVQQKDEPDAGGLIDLSYAPVGLADVTPAIVALVAQGKGDSCGRFCTGTTDIFYLRRTSSGFESIGAWRDLAPGLFFGESAKWSIRPDLFTGPAFVAEGVTGEENNDGYCSRAGYTIIELTPLGPKERAVDVFDGGEVEAGEIKSTIQPAIRNQSFKVVYSGIRNVIITYNRIGDKYLPNNPKLIPKFC